MAKVTENSARVGDPDLDALAARIEREGVAPRVAVAAATTERAAFGGAREAFFDLASVTKPFTAIAFARSGVDPSAPLGSLLEEARGTVSEHVPIELFFAHRAGLEAHREFFRDAPFERAAVLRAAAEARRCDAIGAPPEDGFSPLYSDLGYLLAGEALARATGHEDAGAAIEKLVIEPLGLSAELGTARALERRGLDLGAIAAPTEEVRWRGGVVRGRVHDENAWAFAGAGGAGHAGLFGTVSAVAAFGVWLLDAIDDSEPSLVWTVTPRPGGTLLAGFDGKSAIGSSAGDLAGARTFGHLGFTGTSLWIDPAARHVAVALTNRVHPTRENVAIRTARPWIHDALWARARKLG